MLRSLKEMERYTVSATDGDVGTVVNFLVDDEHWVVRYLVVEIGGLFNKRRVLVSPVSFGRVEWSSRRFHLALTKGKVADSPSVDADKPVSRQHEREHSAYYGYRHYWGASGRWGVGTRPSLLVDGPGNDPPAEQPEKSGDVHLRSAKELLGYHIQGSDGSIGHIADFIVDDETWEVRFLVVDTSNWWFGKKVLVSPHWAHRVSWGERKVYVEMSRRTIKNSPEWMVTSAINREYETRLYDYYGRPGYWENDGRSLETPPPHHHSGGGPGVTPSSRSTESDSH
jgi:sporulation protein YlmC with PRC-barrel domain